MEKTRAKIAQLLQSNYDQIPTEQHVVIDTLADGLVSDWNAWHEDNFRLIYGFEKPFLPTEKYTVKWAAECNFADYGFKDEFLKHLFTEKYERDVQSN